MRDLQQMMKQAQKMAAEVQKAQDELAQQEFEASAGGGAVKVVASGDQRIISISISADSFGSAPDADDLEMLEDSVTAAVNSALDQVRAAQADMLGPLAGGMPGLGLPGS
ncbi:MAG: YbaB/EbfC family nucleoid-associated protein [Actinomycetota bacterium]